VLSTGGYCYINFQNFFYLFFLLVANILFLTIPPWTLWFMNSSQTAIASLFGGDDQTTQTLKEFHFGEKALNFLV